MVGARHKAVRRQVLVVEPLEDGPLVVVGTNMHNLHRGALRELGEPQKRQRRQSPLGGDLLTGGREHLIVDPLGLADHHGPTPRALVTRGECGEIIRTPESFERADGKIAVHVLLAVELHRIGHRIQRLDSFSV